MTSLLRPFILATTFVFTLFLSAVFCASGSAQLTTGWKAHDADRPQPNVVTPADKPGGAPSDAVVLFDGTDMSKWRSKDGNDAKWKIVDGAMESVPRSGFVFSREEFGDCQLHVEFASPKKVKGSGQGRGNSGVFLMGEFEVQVLDSFNNRTYPDGSAGAVYGQYPPLVNASRGPGQWQTYDIIFRRPRFDAEGKVSKNAQLTVLHNGILVQNAVLALGPTGWIQHKTYDSIKGKTKGPISLQDHGNPVRYRNIWVRPLVEERQLPATPYDPVKIDLDQEVAAKLVGKYGAHKVEQKNKKLFLLFHGHSPLEMIPHSAAEYGFKKSAGQVTFTMDDQGNPTGIELKLDAARPIKANRQ